MDPIQMTHILSGVWDLNQEIPDWSGLEEVSSGALRGQVLPSMWPGETEKKEIEMQRRAERDGWQVSEIPFALSPSSSQIPDQMFVTFPWVCYFLLMLKPIKPWFKV